MSDDPSAGYGGLNRRREERVPARFGVHFKGTEEAARAIQTYSVNLSTGGLCLKVQRDYQVSTPWSSCSKWTTGSSRWLASWPGRAKG